MRELVIFGGRGLELVLRVLPAAPSPRIEHVGPVTDRPLGPRSPRPMFTLKDDQRTTLRAHALDAAGNEVTFPSAPTWGLDAAGDPGIATLAPSDDGMTCVLATTGKLGKGAVLLSTPGTAGGDPPPLSERFEFEVTTDGAKSLNVVADAPELRPEFQPAQPAPAGA
jgi:hypothetical protein